MKLTQPQKAAIMRAEPTLYGEESIAICHGRTANRLRAMGLATGNPPHLYLTQEGQAEYQLERVLGGFMSMDGAAAVRQLTDMFAAKPVLLELNGKPMEAIDG